MTESPTPEEYARRSHEQRMRAQAERGPVDRLVTRLSQHLQENSFAERLIEQIVASRRQT